MARTDALSITTNGSTADKLAESYGKVIDSIQKGAISEKIKNTDYSGDPTTGSVEVNRFNNAASNNYGTARTATVAKLLSILTKTKKLLRKLKRKMFASLALATLLLVVLVTMQSA